jgi:hypothetical protein
VLVSHTARVTVNEPSDEIDLEAWLFGLSDADYGACAKGHLGAGVFADEQGRGMINVESIGGHLIIQHYRPVHASRASVEMYSVASRVYLFHLVPVSAAVQWILELIPKTATASDLTCTVQVDLTPVLGRLAQISLLRHFLGRHVEEETVGFVADIRRKQSQTDQRTRGVAGARVNPASFGQPASSRPRVWGEDPNALPHDR